eukprot:scaffold1449_cov108-Isochrysis_galbana.AAC.3
MRRGTRRESKLSGVGPPDIANCGQRALPAPDACHPAVACRWRAQEGQAVSYAAGGVGQTVPAFACARRGDRLRRGGRPWPRRATSSPPFGTRAAPPSPCRTPREPRHVG